MKHSASGQHTEYGERLSREGLVFIQPAQLALLQALLDRPDGMAIGREDVDRAGVPYGYGVKAMIAIVYKSPRAWVSRGWLGRYRTYRLTDRARDILDGRVPVHVIGRGPWAPRSACSIRPSQGDLFRRA